MTRRAVLCLCVTWLLLSGCAATPQHAPVRRDPPDPDRTLYVVRRGWHVDVGMAVVDLGPSLQPWAARFANARYLLFGFGDRRYLLARDKRWDALWAALHKGPALLLLTALTAPPAEAFPDGKVIALHVDAPHWDALQRFVQGAMATDAARSVLPGPYEGSLYVAAVAPYDALHTCNTWAAEALRSAGVPVSSTGTVFAGQLWGQLQRLPPPATDSASR